jgi:hypothetical protein
MTSRHEGIQEPEAGMAMAAYFDVSFAGTAP